MELKWSYLTIFNSILYIDKNNMDFWFHIIFDIFAKIAEGVIAKWVVQDIQDSVDDN